MHLSLDKQTLDKLAQLTDVKGVIKKKREKGSMISMFSASEEKWFCFRGMGRFLVNYEGKKQPVYSALLDY